MTTVTLRKPGRPRDPDRGARRAREILEVAARTFAARGYAETDVQEIADALGVGKGTIYRYFPTKQGLFLAAVDRGLSDLTQAIDQLFDQPGDPLELVRRAITVYLRFFDERPEMAELFIQERAAFRDRHSPLYFAEKYKKHDRDLPFINALIRQGRFRKMRADQVLEVVSDLLYGTVLANHIAGRRVSCKQQANAIVDLLFFGLLSDRERKRLLAQPKPRRGRASLLGVLLCALALGCQPASSQPQQSAAPASADPIAVTVEPVAVRQVERTVQAVGTLHGFDETTLSPKVEGRIASIRVDVGDRVEPGAVLLELDPKDYDLAIHEAEQALAAELAKLGLEALPEGELNVAQVPAVERAAATVEDVRRRLTIRQSLKDAASTDEVALLETELRIAEAVRRHAETEARATLAAARLRQATLELARQRRRDCTLRAPLPSEWLVRQLPPGQQLHYAVAQRMVSEGEMVRAMPATNAFKLVLDFNLKLRVLIPERHTAEVRVGQPVDVLCEAHAGRTFAGRVARVNPTIDPSNRTFAVEVEVPNPEGALKSGGFAKAVIHTQQAEAVRTVPPEAIVSFAGVHKIFLLDGDKARAVEVKLGSRDRDWVEVIGSIPPDARVLTSGLSQVVDGTAVRLRSGS